jgi:stage III sporulation protein SpoIIIAA
MANNFIFSESEYVFLQRAGCHLGVGYIERIETEEMYVSSVSDITALTCHIHLQRISLVTDIPATFQVRGVHGMLYVLVVPIMNQSRVVMYVASHFTGNAT